MNINPMAAPLAAMGRYIRAFANPGLMVSGISGGGSSMSSPSGSRGGRRLSGRRTTTIPTAASLRIAMTRSQFWVILVIPGWCVR
ncbi:hypothetical protein GCM10009727_87900 [Actinomadura napierensis]|uniref:Uncharacterized protein n=1 Tax=Actinomadura napierensis TaxID=267854 RepID=A0ABP5MAP2_9ACTN